MQIGLTKEAYARALTLSGHEWRVLLIQPRVSFALFSDPILCRIMSCFHVWLN